jgi:hypothetical protein
VVPTTRRPSIHRTSKSLIAGMSCTDQCACAEDLVLVSLHSLPEDCIDTLCAVLADDLCTGVYSLIRLSRTCKRLYDVVASPRCVQRCADQHGLKVLALEGERSSSGVLEVLGVIETVVGLGTNRIYFQKRKAIIRPGSSRARLEEFALLLRRHPRLRLSIDGHESSLESIMHTASDGTQLRASLGLAQQRAQAVKDALIELECLDHVDRRGSRVWGRLPSVRFESRVKCTGWEDAVAQAAGWSAGLDSCHAECFFTLECSTTRSTSDAGGRGGAAPDTAPTSIEVPRRPCHYDEAAQERQRQAGWQQQHISIISAALAGV